MLESSSPSSQGRGRRRRNRKQRVQGGKRKTTRKAMRESADLGRCANVHISGNPLWPQMCSFPGAPSLGKSVGGQVCACVKRRNPNGGWRKSDALEGAPDLKQHHLCPHQVPLPPQTLDGQGQPGTGAKTSEYRSYSHIPPF